VLIPDGYAQLNFLFSGSALPYPAEVTLGVGVAEFPGGPEVAAEEAGDIWAARISPQQNESTILTGVLCKFGPNSTGPAAEVANGTVGTLGGSGVVPNTSVLIKKITSTGGRQGQGRMFMPGYVEEKILSNGLITGANLTALQTAFDNFHADLIAADLIPVLLSAEGSPNPVPRTVSGFQVQSLVATQRRRMRK